MVPVILATLLLILDQLTKFIATRFVTINTGVKTLIPGVLQMVNVRNDGSALALITGNRTVLLAILGVLTVLVPILVWKVVKGGFARTSLLILLAGVLGNGLDRALFGYVTDMFELLFLPNIIFNLADVLMGIGAIFFALSLLFSRGRDDDDEDEDEDNEDDDEEDERPRRRLFGKRRDEEDNEDEEDEDEEDERPRRRLFGKHRDEDEEDDEDEDEHPVRRNAVAAKAAPAKKPVASASARTAPAQPQRAAAPVQTQRSAAPAQRPVAASAPAQAQRPAAAAPVQTQRSAAPAQRPVAATAPAQAQRPVAAQAQRAAAPVESAAPVQKAAAPAPRKAVVEEEFDLDSILNEFK